MKQIACILFLVFGVVIGVKAQVWQEVTGNASIIIPNSLDIDDIKNITAKKKLIVKATIEAVKNSVRVSSNAIFSSRDFEKLISNNDYSEDDFIYTEFMKQNIEWQRTETPKFSRDESQENKWICETHGLVQQPSDKKRLNEAPLVVENPVIVEKSQATITPLSEPVAVEQSNKEIRKDRHYSLGLTGNYQTFLPNKGFSSLEKKLALPASLSLVSAPRTINVGIEIPTKSGLRIGLAYQNTAFNLESSTYYSKDGGYQERQFSGYYEDDYFKKMTLHGINLNFGSYKNAINPNIGFSYSAGANTLSNNTTINHVSDRLSVVTPTNSNSVLEIAGANFGFDFGRRWFKVGINGGMNWLSNSEEMFKPKFDITDYSMSVGGGVKIFF